MIRLLLLVALLYVIWRIVRHWWRQLPGPSRPRGEQQPIPMLRCDQCHTHFPASDARRHEGRVFCSNAHLEDWRNNQ